MAVQLAEKCGLQQIIALTGVVQMAEKGGAGRVLIPHRVLFDRVPSLAYPLVAVIASQPVDGQQWTHSRALPLGALEVIDIAHAKRMD